MPAVLLQSTQKRGMRKCEMQKQGRRRKKGSETQSMPQREPRRRGKRRGERRWETTLEWVRRNKERRNPSEGQTRKRPSA